MKGRYPIAVRKTLDEWRFFVEDEVMGSEGIRKREEWRFFSGPFLVGGMQDCFSSEYVAEVAAIIAGFDVQPERDSLGYVWTDEGEALSALRRVYLALEAARRGRKGGR